jgi:hypothetical protein
VISPSAARDRGHLLVTRSPASTTIAEAGCRNARHAPSAGAGPGAGAAARATEERICEPSTRPSSFQQPALPIEYRVRRVRDGRRFAQRQVTAWQRGREILLANASFSMATGETAEHQHEPMPQVTGPEG